MIKFITIIIKVIILIIRIIIFFTRLYKMFAVREGRSSILTFEILSSI